MIFGRSMIEALKRCLIISTSNIIWLDPKRTKAGIYGNKVFLFDKQSFGLVSVPFFAIVPMFEIDRKKNPHKIQKAIFSIFSVKSTR